MKKSYSIKDILDFNPCEKYTKEYLRELFESVGCKKTMPIKNIFDVDIPVDDLMWLIFREDFIQEKELHYFAIWCFENIAQKIWEKYYPDDTHPQDAIRIKKLWLEGKATDDELAAARAAAQEKIKMHLKEIVLKQNKG